MSSDVSKILATLRGWFCETRQKSDKTGIEYSNCYFLYLFLPLSVFLLLVLWAPLLGNSSIAINGVSLKPEGLSAAESTNRYYVIGLTFIFCSACFGAAVLAVSTVRFALCEIIKPLAGGLVFLFAAAALIWWGVPRYLKYILGKDYPDELYMFAGRSVFESTLGVLSHRDGTLLDLLNCIITVANICVIFTALILALCACAQLAAITSLNHKKPEERKELGRFYAERMRSLNKLLYAGAFILVIGVLQSRIWLQWPLAFISGKDATKQFIDITTAIYTVQGTFFTVILASIYLPPSLTLWNRVQGLGSFEEPAQSAKAATGSKAAKSKASKSGTQAAAGTDGDFAKWLKEIGWPSIGGKDFKPLITILLPALTGPFAALIQLIPNLM